MPFDEPDKSFDGIRINPRDVLGHLLLVWATEYIPNSPTRYTKPGQVSDVIVVDVVDLDATDPDTGQPGLLAQSVWWRQAKLIQSLKAKVGTPLPVLGWMSQGSATPGNNAPFKLESANADPKAVARGEQWIAQHPDFKPAVSVQRDTQPMPEPVSYDQPQESMLERMARQAREGADRLPLPPQQPDSPGF
jgi:hypothetical protein